ncbi:hypothetical protein S83_009814 [Arachis hypogaea]
MPDASMDATLDALVSAGFRAAGERSMALNTAIFVGGSMRRYSLYLDFFTFFYSFSLCYSRELHFFLSVISILGAVELTLYLPFNNALLISGIYNEGFFRCQVCFQPKLLF